MWSCRWLCVISGRKENMQTKGVVMDLSKCGGVCRPDCVHYKVGVACAPEQRFIGNGSKIEDLLDRHQEVTNDLVLAICNAIDQARNKNMQYATIVGILQMIASDIIDEGKSV